MRALFENSIFILAGYVYKRVTMSSRVTPSPQLSSASLKTYLIARASFLLLSTLYFVVLFFMVIFIGAESFDPLGYPTSSVPLRLALIFLLLAITPSLWLPRSFKRPSALLFWALYVIVYVPANVVPALTHTSPARFLTLSLVLLLSMGLIGASYRLPLLNLPRIPLSRRAFWGLVAVGSIAVAAIVQLTIGFEFSAPGLGSIYTDRGEYAAQIATHGPVMRRIAVYSLNWLYLLAAPLLLAVGFVRRRPVPIVIGYLILWSVYSVTGFKTALFVATGLPLLLAFITAISRLQSTDELPSWVRTAPIPSVFLGAPIAVTALSIIVYSLAEVARPISTVRRLLIVPGFWSGNYYDWFITRGNPLVYFSDRFYGVVEYPYDVPLKNLMSGVYLDNPSVNVSVSFLTDGMSIFGLPGIVFTTLVFVLILYLYDSFTQFIDWRVATAWLTGIAIVVTNSSIITALLTNGLLVLLVGAYLYGCAENSSRDNSLG